MPNAKRTTKSKEDDNKIGKDDGTDDGAVDDGMGENTATMRSRGQWQ